MAVYTPLDRATLEALIEPFAIGSLIDFTGVAGGVENTNYFVTTTGAPDSSVPQQFVLTLFEQVDAADLGFYIDLTTLLNHRGLPVPCPVTDTDGVALRLLKGKPALLVPRVKGFHPLHPNAAQCRELGAALARAHLACLDWPVSHESIRSVAWLKRTARAIAPRLESSELPLLDEIPRFERLVQQHPGLPRAVIHGDLFRDNALFDGNTLTGLIDFNSAGDGYLLMDLAVVVNDWCCNVDGSINPSLANPLLCAYRQIRPLSENEQSLWNDFLRLAALRFWVSRRSAQLGLPGQPSGHLVEEKDPEEFRQILWQRIHHPRQLNP